MNGLLLVLPVILPLGASLLCLLPGEGRARASGSIAVVATAVTLGIAVLAAGWHAALALPWFEPGFTFALRTSRASAFLLVAIAGFAFLTTLYATLFLQGWRAAHRFFFFAVATVAFANGVVLADDLVVLLVFWEGLLITGFAMIVTGRPAAYATAIKSFIIVGLSDLCLMAGVILTGSLAHTLRLSGIHLPASGAASLAFVLLFIGALGKAGAMPFHSWIPDAAIDAPLPFMALLPASIEKLLGIYLLARITLDLFAVEPGSWLSTLMMIVGALTILLAVMMALAQKSYKRLLAYHAISQVGYMVLGVGTALPIGIVGGLFHMINHAIYKSGLFLTAGSVERQTGTTELARLGGLARAMPVTFVLFVIVAAAICGVPPLNGFFSKELIYEAALARGWPFYAAALLGTFLTAASFLKLGHAVYLGRHRTGGRESEGLGERPTGAEPSGAILARGPAAPAEGEAEGRVREAPWPILLPIAVLAAACLLFGLDNPLPLRHFIEPILGVRLAGESFGGLPRSLPLTLATVVVLLAALLNHLWGARRSGSGLAADDHILHGPLLRRVYPPALAGRLDPYAIGRPAVRGLAVALHAIDRAVDWLYEGLAVGVKSALAGLLSRAQSGSFRLYLLWMTIAVIVVIVTAVR